MDKIIEITNIKNISKLEFTLPKKHDVYVLTGANGTGKTTLMTCLLRIGQTRAFPDNFKTGNVKFDNFDGEIKYIIKDKGKEEYVSYRHTGVRWPPTPRKNTIVLQKFGYPEVRFLPATGNRLYVNEDIIEAQEVKRVEKDFIDDMNFVLGSSKFSDLRYIQTGSVRGPGGGSQRWKRAYVIKKSKSYYSEKNFSLGEILVLNTLLLIQDVTKGSMLLIDELEMALHPKVQKRLFELLEIKAKEKKLTIIFSTHSSSLIKSANNIIYLENDEYGNVKVTDKCYPAVVLREVAIEEDIQPDYLFTVEDDMARMLLTEILNYYFKVKENSLKPVYKIIPIGGYSNLLEFTRNTNNYLFSKKIGQYIFFDSDVEEVKNNLLRVGNARSNAEQELFDLFMEYEDRYYYLPITPELGVWQWLLDNKIVFQREFNNIYQSAIDMLEIIRETEQHFTNESDNDSGGERKKAKRRVKHMIGILRDKSKLDENRILQFLFSQFINTYYSTSTNNLNDLKSCFGKIFNTRRPL